MTDDQLLEQAVARVEERAEALAARRKTPGLVEVVNIAVTLDGIFDVAVQLVEEDDTAKALQPLFQNGLVVAMRNSLKLAGVPDDEAYAVAKDVLAIVAERRAVQDLINNRKGGDK